MSLYLTITDSLSSSAGGLSHASLNHALSIAQAMPEEQHILLVQKDTNELEPTFKIPNNLKIIKAPCFRNPYFPISKELNSSLFNLNPDVVHLRGLWRQSSLAAIAWKTSNSDKCLIVQTAGMLEPWARQRNSFLKKIYFAQVESRLIQLCDYFHATSETERQSLIDLGIPSRKIFVVEEGIYLPPLGVVQDSAEMRSKSPYKLLFLSRLHPVKGLDLLLKSLSLLRPVDWTCQIVGSGSTQYENYLRQEINRLKLVDYIQLSGPLLGVQKDEAFASASAFILPSYSESYGIAIAEAMSWSLPVITTTSTPWLDISDYGLGWCVPSNSLEISQALFSLFTTDSFTRQQLGRKSRDYVAAKLAWTAVAQRMRSIYLAL